MYERDFFLDSFLKNVFFSFKKIDCEEKCRLLLNDDINPS